MAAARAGAGRIFSLAVKWLCAPRGRACGVGQVFSFGQMACAPRGPERRAGFFFKLVRAPVRGLERFFIKANVLF